MADIVVVIRSVEERTEQACLDIVRSQVGPDSPIHLVRNKPFAEAHIESLRLAAQSEAEWALFLDADVLLRHNAIQIMLREAETILWPFYMLNFRILDRGFDGPAYAGVHLYRVEYFHTALQYADLALEAQRPESRLCMEVALRARIPTLSSLQVVGLHGYEQFYRDIYRTAFVRAVKFRQGFDYLLSRYRSRYEVGNKEDQDNRMMFWGVVDGMVYQFNHDYAPLDKSFYQEHACQILALLGLNEKGPLMLDQDAVDPALHEHSPDEHYRANQHWICPSEFIAHPIPDRSLSKQVCRQIRRSLLSFGRRAKRALLALTTD